MGLCTRLVVRAAGASTLPRALLLEAELHMIASRYRQALVAAIALQLATTPAGGPGGCFDRKSGESEGLAKTTFATAAAVVEMVSCYQLGDRERAVQLRETLRTVIPQAASELDPNIQISQHLQARFKGTSEVLELVPGLLELLRRSEEEQAGS